jgi:transcriptional regulator with XRE-family HTH domain
MPDRELMMLGEQIRKLRIERGISQVALAEAAELHRNMIGLLERGQRWPSLPALLRISRALNVRPRQLFWNL